MISSPGPNLSARQSATPSPSYAPSAKNRATLTSISASKSGSAVSSPTCSVVSSEAAISPVSRSSQMWSLRHVLRAFLVPCFSSCQQLAPRTFRPVLSTMSVIGLLAFRRFWAILSPLPRRERVEKSGTTRSMPISRAIDLMKP